MKQHFSIAILTCWYGHYPWYFPYFIDSCSYNSTIDFFIMTNNRTAIPEGLVTRYEKIIQYRTGLSIQADIITDKRRLLERLFGNFRSKLN